MKKPMLLTVAVIAVMVALVYANTIREIPNSPVLPGMFVGNLTQIDERVVVTTVILKKDTPVLVAQELYNYVRGLYTREDRVSVNGRYITVREVRVSNMVRDREGRFLFRVVEKPEVVQRVLNRYENYVERILVKPVPTTTDKSLDVLPDKKLIAPSNAIIRDLIGVSQVESVYGVTGRGVNIAIVDTGVDYGHPDLSTALRFWTGTYKGDQIREPLVFDADQQQVLLLQEVPIINGSTIYVGGRYYNTLIPWEVYIYPPCEWYKLPALAIESVKFGVTYMPRYDGVKIVGVALLKLRGWNYYGHAVVDVNNNCDFSDEFATAPPFTDSYGRGGFLRYFSNRIIAPDYNRNGYPDDSLGVAGGFFYDWWWYFSYPAEIHPGWDKQGRWLSIFYDFHGHGTAAASAAAGRGVVAYNITGIGVVRLRGMAPEAGIIGVKGLWIGNVEVGMLWAAGFDVDPYTGRFYYTGSRRAHIISNSWGISTFIYDVAGFGYDLESVFITGLALPGFLDPSYPGILIVQAGGNGGPGYGTITSPGAAVGALTVGASTSTHFAYSLSRQDPSLANIFMSGAGRSNDEIISWSLRGPTVVGYNKPDVVNVGAFGYTAAVVPYNFTLFGGTSYATPLTAGVAALVYQVLGEAADPALVKTIITSTANPLRYDVASEGAGRVNAFRAVSLARLLAGQRAARYELLIQSNSLWGGFAGKASNIWRWQWCDNIAAYMLWWAGTELSVSCNMPSTAANRVDTTLFFGDVPQGGSKTISFTIRNPTNRTVAITMEPRQFVLTRSLNLTRWLSLSSDAFMNRTYILLTSSNLTFTYRFLEVVVSTPYSYFDPENDYVFNVRTRVWIHIWRADTNGNGRPDPDEMVLVNYGYNFYSWNLATISYPTVKLGGNRAIVVTVDIVRGPGSSGYVPPIPVTITLNYVDTSRDPWVTVSPSNVNIPPGGTATFSLTVRPPSDAIPTTYIGQIVVINNVTGWWNSIPYTFNVFTTVDGNFKVLTSGANGRWPILNRIRGANDWAWRYESGDWRWFYARPSGSNGLAFEFQALWSAPDTSLIAYALGPDGQFAGVFYGQGASLHYHLGSGVFEWSNTGAGSIQNARRVVIFPAVEYRYWLYPHTKPETGVYTFIVRTALYDGITGASEPFTAQIRLLPAAQKLPSTIIGSGSATIRFSLPYIVGSMDAYMSRPYTPLLSVDQRYTPIYASISPSTLAGPYPANTQFTFQVNVYHNGAPGQSVDISALFLARLPSLPVYMRYNNNYYRETDSYIFEDWLTLTR